MGVKLKMCLTAPVVIVALFLDFPFLLSFPGTLHKPALAATPVKTVPPQKRPVTADPQKMAKEFAELCKNASPGQWVLYQGNPVLIGSALWQWDDFNVGSPVVFEEGGHYRMWYRGCHFMGEEYSCGIGYAVSRDGVVWEKRRDPVISPADPVDSRRLNTVAVVRAGGRYIMFYSVDADWRRRRPATVYLATSLDGLRWEPGRSVLEPVGEGIMSIEHAALYDGKTFHLWYVDMPYADGSKVLLHVISSDGEDWRIAGTTFMDELKIDPGRMTVFSDGHGSYRGLFAYPPPMPEQRGLFGILTSIDGNSWKLFEGGAKPQERSLGKKGFIPGAPTMIRESGSRLVWFELRPISGAETIGVACQREDKQ
jgi:hypothetical protein